MSLGAALWLGASVTAGTFGPVPAQLWQERTGEPYELQARAMRRLADQPMERVRAAPVVRALDAAFWDATESDCAPGIAALERLFDARAGRPLVLATVPAIWRDDFQPCRLTLNAYMVDHCTDACTLIRLEGALAPPGLHPGAEYLNRLLDALPKRSTE